MPSAPVAAAATCLPAIKFILPRIRLRIATAIDDLIDILDPQEVSE